MVSASFCLPSSKFRHKASSDILDTVPGSWKKIYPGKDKMFDQYLLLANSLPDLIPLSFGRVINRMHVLLQNIIKHFSGVTWPVQLLPCPDGMQVVPPTPFIQFMYFRLLLNQLIQKELIIRESLEEGIPLGKTIALGGI